MSGASGAVIALAAALALLPGCAAKRGHYATPEVPLPGQYREARSTLEVAAPDPGLPRGPERAPASTPSELQLADAMLAEWWKVLGSAELDSLMEMALANNADLRVATLRIAQAKARADQAHADRFPVVSLPYEARSESPAGGVGSVPSGQNPVSRRLYQGSVRGDWRLDVFGEREAAAESAQSQLWRAVFQRDDARRQLSGSVVALYIEYLSLNDRLREARDTEGALTGFLEGLGTRLKVGDATITEFEQQRAAVYSVRATIPALELQRESAVNALAQLLGVTSASLKLSPGGLDGLAFPRVLPGVPANLLARRPDVRAVESRLLSADADIDVARTRLLPAIDLSSSAGYGGLMFSRLFLSSNFAWNAIASLSAVIFDAGRRANDVVYAQAFHEELVETYVRVIYGAIREVEDAIAMVQMNSRRLDAQGVATAAARRAWEMSRIAYAEGAIDYLQLLDTERTYHRNLDEYHRVAMERHKGLAALFGALGGGVPAAELRDGVARTTADQAAVQFQLSLDDPADPFWLVELGGLQDRPGIQHVWRDLRQRFAAEMEGRILYPRLRGEVATPSESRSAWYRIYVARFAGEAEAARFCSRLSEALVRCRTVPSDSPTFRNEVSSSPLLEALHQRSDQDRPRARATASSGLVEDAAPIAPAAKAPGIEVSEGGAARGQEGAQVAVRAPVAAVQSAPSRAEPPVTAPVIAPVTAPASTGAAVEPAQAEQARPRYSIQLYTAHQREAATQTAQAWTAKGYAAYVYPVEGRNRILYSVRTGLHARRATADAEALAIHQRERVTAVVVPVSVDGDGRPAPRVVTAAASRDTRP